MTKTKRSTSPSPTHVLVVSTALDLATDAVVRALDAAGVRVTRCNTEEVPFQSRLTLTITPTCRIPPSIVLQRLGQDACPSLEDVSCVWYRRIRAPTRPADMDPGVYEFCVRESRAALLGSLLGAVSSSTAWMSHPSKVWEAEHKLYQLSVARQAGLTIPDTTVTNDPQEVRAAFQRHGGYLIAKPARSGYVEVGGEPRAIYTSQVSVEHLDALGGIDSSPVIYQPLIRKRCDVRVTVVGDRVFVAEIDSQTNADAHIDWRRTSDPALPHRAAELPGEVTAGVHRLMRLLGLEFGALDFVRTPEDEYIFLEVNPNGQWLWLDLQLGFGVTEAVAQWLTTPPRMN